MALKVYLPTKLESEKTRYKNLLGNTQLDYRSETGSAPYLLGTPYKESNYNDINLDVASALVPEDVHITGDQTNYRRFSTDVLLVSDDYQRNLVVLFVNGIQLTAVYDYSYYTKNEPNAEGIVIHDENHIFKVLNTNGGETLLNSSVYALYNVKPLVLDITQEEVGYIDKSNVLVVKRKKLGFEEKAYYDYSEMNVTHSEEEGTSGSPTIIMTLPSEKAIVVDNERIPADQVSDVIKSLNTFTASFKPDSDYYAHLLYVSSFIKNGTIFATSNGPVLNDAYRNYHVYSVSKGTDQDIIGYSINISPSAGVFLHAVLGTGDRDFSQYTDIVVGQSSFLYKTIYTGLLGSPYVMLKFNINESDTFKMKVNDTVHELGSYSKENFYELFNKIDTILYPLGLLPICYEGYHISLDRRTSSTTPIEVSFETTKTSIVTVDYFVDMPVFEEPEILISSGVISHPKNSSFTYLEPIMVEGEDGYLEPVNDNLNFKFVITENGNRPFNFGTKSITLDTNEIKGRTLMVTIKLGRDTITGEIVFDENDTVSQIVDKVYNLIVENVTSSRYKFTKNYDDATISVLDRYSSNTIFEVTLDIIDEEPPVLVSAQVDTNGIIYITYNEKLMIGSLDAETFTVFADGVGLDVKTAEVFAEDETRIKVTTFPQIGEDQVVSIAYTGTVVKDTIGNLATPFNTATEAINVVNNSSNIPTTDMDVLSINPYTIPYGNYQEIVPLIYNSVTDKYSIDYDKDFIAKTDEYLRFVHQFNNVLREHGYEATPLFLDSAKTTLSPNIGIMKIAENDNLFIGTFKDDELRLGSAKGLYIPYTTAKLVSKNNFTIESYTNFPEDISARLYMLGSTENTVYKSGNIIEGKLVIKDNFVIGYKHSDYSGGHFGNRTLNFLTDPFTAYNYFLWFILTGEGTWTMINENEWTRSDTNISFNFNNGSCKFSIDTSTGIFRIELDPRYTGISCLIKLENESDLTITKGGIFTSAPSWMSEMETTPGSVNKLFLSFYNQNIDGDGL